MSTSIVLIFISLAFIAANLPWLTDRVIGLIPLNKYPQKPVWFRLLEWVIMYFLLGGIAIGFESKLNGQIHPQSWEFYIINLCLFFVLSVPGFIYHYQIKRNS
jgi:hypothetical protein